MVKYQPPRGTRDFLPADMVVRNQVETVIRTTFESYGFQQVQTPIFEQYELLAARSGEEIKESMFTFASDAGRYALRPELTSPVCRLVASNALHSLNQPYKLYYFGPCFRYCRPQPGRYREFYQAGVELMGCGGPLADAEAIAVAVKTVSRLGIRDFQIRVGDVGVFRQLLEEYLGKDAQAQERQSRVISDIDKIMHVREKCALFAGQNSLSADEQTYLGSVSNSLHKIQKEVGYSGEFAVSPDRAETPSRLPAAAEATYRAAWIEHGFLPADRADFLIAVSRVRGPANEAMSTAKELLAGTSALQPLEELSKVCDWLPGLGVAKFEIVLGMVRNLDFYTGTVFEIDAPVLGAQKQVCGGGRYDKLVEEFGGPAIPATGFAFGFDRLVEAFKTSAGEIDVAAVDVMVVSPPASRKQAVELAEGLRTKASLRVGVDLAGLDLKGQVEYGDKVGAAFTVIVGVDGVDGLHCKLRRAKQETIVSLALLEQVILSGLEKGNRQ